MSSFQFKKEKKGGENGREWKDRKGMALLLTKLISSNTIKEDVALFVIFFLLKMFKEKI